MRLIKKGIIMEQRDYILPIRIVDSFKVENAERLLSQGEENQSDCKTDYGVSFRTSSWTEFQGKGSYIILDFGRELCGGLRMIMRSCVNTTRWRLTFGESLTEACSTIGENNATNHHSPRDLEYGQTGFRFVRIELLDEGWPIVQYFMAVSTLPFFESEAEIITNDARLNDIIQTAAYTLKLCFQKAPYKPNLPAQEHAIDIRPVEVNPSFFSHLFLPVSPVHSSCDFRKGCKTESQSKPLLHKKVRSYSS